MRKTAKYKNDLPKKLYTYFTTYAEPIGAPSFSKFARSIGATLKDIERFRGHREFARAYDECNEIRRDYLIDNALTKKFDGSVTKFILTAEFGMGERDDTAKDEGLEVTLSVIEENKS